MKLVMRASMQNSMANQGTGSKSQKAPERAIPGYQTDLYNFNTTLNLAIHFIFLR